MLNVVDGVYAANFAPIESITPRPGGLAIVSQSGAIAGSLLARANQRQIGISHVISTGNETATTMADYLDALVEDDRVRAISLYLEGANDPRALVAALTRATQAGKSVVVLKVGDSEVGARAALSHTAKLAGEPRLYRGAFEQAGVIQAHSLPDVIDLQMYLMSERDPARAVDGVCIVSISGGLGAVAADEFSRAGIAVPELDASVRAELDGLGIGATANPVDTASATQRGDGVFTAALAAIGRDPRIDAIVVPLASRFAAAARATPDDLLHARDAAGVPVLAAWYAGEDNADAVAQLRASGRIACFDDAGACARALRAANRAAPAVAPAAEAAVLALDPALRGVLDEPTSKALLAAHGIAFAAEAVADRDPDAIRKAADEIGYPVALKVVSADIMHKAAVGGVRLGLGDGDAVTQAAREMLATVAREAPDAQVSGVLVSAMVDVAEEFIVGAYDDASFGPTLAFGSGGSRVEQLDDVQLRLLPIGRAEVARLVDARLGAAAAPGVREELIAQVDRIATFAASTGPRLRELDVNPLVVTADGTVVALDAVIRLDDERQE
jgi:acyl-CoA synthetase (NDP forming)